MIKRQKTGRDEHKPSTILDEPDAALTGYLQQLLDEIPEDVPPEEIKAKTETKPKAKPKAKPLRTPPKVKPVKTRVPRKAPLAAEAREQSKVEARPVVESAVKTGAAPVSETTTAEETKIETASEAVVYQHPDWSRETFQLINFETAGSRLSMPLVCLRSINRLERELTKLPGMPYWQLGVTTIRDEKISVIDLARLLAPDSAPRPRVESGFVLVLEGAPWGLLCERLGDAGRLAPDEVRWRRGQDNPPYIEGVARDSLTPLLSSRDILAMLGGK